MYYIAAWAPSSLYDARPITLNTTSIDTIRSPEFSQAVGMVGFGYEEALSIIFVLAVSAVPPFDIMLEEQTPEDYKERDMSAFRYVTVLWGYGYGGRSTSIWLAMAVMVTYCAITIFYLAYILATGFTFTAWNSAIELVALALQSQKPDHLGNIGVGLDSIETFKEGVGIRVNQENELELVFAHDRDIDKRGLRKIERNKEY